MSLLSTACCSFSALSAVFHFSSFSPHLFLAFSESLLSACVFGAEAVLMKHIFFQNQFAELCQIIVKLIALLLLRESAGRFSNPVCRLSKSGQLGLYVSVFWRSTKSGCKRVFLKADDMSSSESMEAWSSCMVSAQFYIWVDVD